MKNLSFTLFSFVFLAGCAPYQDADINLPPAPDAPQFTVEVLASDPNKVVVTDLSTGFFSRVWDFTGGLPPASTRATDTIFYAKKGDYTITLHTAAEGGGGTSQASKTVSIAENAATGCDPQVALLTGDCGPAGKCWTFSTAAAAVRVGPAPGSSEWFTSTANGLQAAQYDDSFCFYFDGAHFEYDNQGQSVDPWNGYAVVDYTPPSDYTWFLSKGSGPNGADQIILPDGAFMGVWDSGPVYDIVSISEDQLVVRSPIINVAGWFELTFVRR